MKKVVLFIILFTFLLRGGITAQNPYESIGKEMPKGKILTLTNGKYPEVIENDTLVRIGSVMFNTITGEVVAFLEKDTLYAEYNLEPDLVSRWLSPDPLAEKYLQWSPYVYGADNPIRFIDPNGKELVDPKGNKITYTKNEDGSLTWSKNATTDVMRLGNAMAKTSIGMTQLDGLSGSKTKVSLKISQEIRRDKSGNLVRGFNQPTLSSDGKTITKAEITIYEGSLKQGFKEKNAKNEDLGMKNPNDKNENVVLNYYSRDDNLGATGVHEATHTLDRSSSRGLSPGKKQSEYEKKPEENQYQHYKELDDVYQKEYEKTKKLPKGDNGND